MRQIILDTDTGVDDALAICLALRSPELRVEAITAVHGNVPVGLAAGNILRTLDVLNPANPPPVAAGAARPLRREPVHADDVHGWDGLGGATKLPEYPPSSRTLDPRPAIQVFYDTIWRFPNEVTLVAVGPLTNAAQAIENNPGRMARLAGIVVMGGAFRRQGNMSPVAEFNIFCDPHAAQIVLESGIPVTMVPLDASEQVVLTREMTAKHVNHRVGRFVRDITGAYMDFGERVENVPGCYVHDALTIAYLIQPSLFGTVSRRVAVETEGTVAFGQTIADLREPPRFAIAPNAHIVLDVDVAGFLSLFAERVLRSEGVEVTDG